MNDPNGLPSQVGTVGASKKSSDAFLEKVYSELRQLAAARISQESDPQTLQPTALVHEAWLRLDPNDKTWESTGHFFGAAARAMRRILIDRARGRSRIKRGGDQTRVDFESFDLAEATTDERVLLINDALEKLTAADPEQAEIVELKFFGGLSNAEVANFLNVTERTVERKWAFAKSWLFSAIEDDMRVDAPNLSDSNRK